MVFTNENYTSRQTSLMIFFRILKIKSCQKVKQNYYGPKNGKLWIHTSVATLETYKRESGMKTNCYKYKKKATEVISEWFLTTRMAATTRRISIFTLSLLKIRAFFQMFPNVCFLISQKWNKISTNGVHRYKLFSLEAGVQRMSEIGRNSDIEKLLQTKSALTEFVKWV